MEIWVRVLGFLLMILDHITKPIFWLLSRKNKKRLPPINDPLLLMSATKLAKLIRNRKVSSQHVVELFIRRVQEVNPFINAVVEDRFKHATSEAKEVDDLIDQIANNEIELSNLEKTKPFLGVPVTIKESCAVSGMSQCVGSLPRLGTKAIRDCQAVALIRSSGAIPILISNTPELCLSWESNNFITGKTCNPYDLNRTCGGSSGGEGALVGSGASVFGVASDIAGSIRVPAMFNGIFGHKPTPGIVSIDGHYPTSDDESFANFLTIGPLTRYSEDLMPMLKVMAGNNADCLNLDIPVDPKELKVFYMMEAGKSITFMPIDKEIQIAMKKSIEYLRNTCSLKVEEINFPDMADSVEISVSVFFGMKDLPDLISDSSNPKKRRNVYAELFKTVLGFGSFSLQTLSFFLMQETNLFIPKSKYSDYCERARRLRNEIKDVLGDDGVFLYPTFPIPAFYHNQVFTKPAGVMYTMIFNVLGLPSTHVPLGLNSKGLPVGIQVIAGPKKDRLCLATARLLEERFGGWVPPP